MRNLFLQAIRNNVAVISIFGIWSAIIYSNTINATFHYDDYFHIVNNPNIQWEEVSWENVVRTLQSKEESLSRPVANLTFALNYYVGGLDVSGYHYVNIGIHIITAFVFFLFLKTVFSLPHFGHKIQNKNYEIAFIASLLWLSSPLQIQAVTYIVQRMAALAAMFYVSAIYFFLKGRTSYGNKVYLYYILSILSSLLAVGSKENAITIPLFILVLEITILRKGDIGFIFKKRILLFLGVILTIYSALLLYYYFITVTKADKWFIYMLEMHFFTSVRAIAFYLTHLLFPIPSRLSIQHDFQVSQSLFEPLSTVLILPILIGIMIYALLSVRKRPLFSFFALWFFGNLAIETFHPYLITIFEHRLYLPSMGFFALVGIGVYNAATPLKIKGVKFIALGIVIALFSTNTYIRNNIWKDEYTLWGDVIKKSPNIAIGYIQVGNALFKDEDYEAALNYYLKARSIEPRNVAVRYGLGVIYFNLKGYEAAIAELSQVGSMGYVIVNRHDPSISYYFSRIAKNYYGHGRVDDAIEVLERALLYDPNEPRLKELKEKMVKGAITAKEIMSK